MPEARSVTWPAPSNRLPSQWVVALRVVAMPRVFQTAHRSAEWAGEHLLRRDRRRRTFRRIVARFYEGVADRPGAPRALPGGGPRPGRGAVPAVPGAVLGRPTTYSDTRGHPRLRMRHAPFAVTPTAKDHWLTHFRAALDEVGADAGAGRAVLGLRHPRRAVHGEHLRGRLARVRSDQFRTRCNARRRPATEKWCGRRPHRRRPCWEAPPQPRGGETPGWPDGDSFPVLPSGRPPNTHLMEENHSVAGPEDRPTPARAGPGAAGAAVRSAAHRPHVGATGHTARSLLSAATVLVVAGLSWLTGTLPGVASPFDRHPTHQPTHQQAPLEPSGEQQPHWRTWSRPGRRSCRRDR